jgi:hypothetical protein
MITPAGYGTARFFLKNKHNRIIMAMAAMKGNPNAISLLFMLQV